MIAFARFNNAILNDVDSFRSFARVTRTSGATQLRYANPRPSTLAAVATSVYVARWYSLVVYSSRKFAGGHLGES